MSVELTSENENYNILSKDHSMNACLDELIVEYKSCIQEIEKKIAHHLRKLSIPLILIELTIYIGVIITLVWLYERLWSENKSFYIEILVIIPIIFLYVDYNVFLDVNEKKKCVKRYTAILDHLLAVSKSVSPEKWDDISVEFEEGEISYCYVYRDHSWLRWPILLLVTGDVICFPNDDIQHYAPDIAIQSIKLEDMDTKEHEGASRFLQSRHIQQYYCVLSYPIRQFILKTFNMDFTNDQQTMSSAYDFKHRFCERITRWLHGDLSLPSSTSTSASSDMSTQALNYSAYHKLYRYIYVSFTYITWALALLVFILNVPSLHLYDLRLVIITFFICPLAVAILESIYQHLYFYVVLGYWKYMNVEHDYSVPLFSSIQRYYSMYRRSPLEYASCTPLVSLPYCTNLNVVSKNVVCRDCPGICGLYTACYKKAQKTFVTNRDDSSVSTKGKKKTLQLELLSLYNNKNRLCFFDNKWRENLDTLKPTGLLTLLMGNRGNYVVKDSETIRQGDAVISLSNYIKYLSNNFYKDTFYEVADAIGFLQEDAGCHTMLGKLNFLKEKRDSDIDNEASSLSIRYKVGGRYFNDVYVFCLYTSSDTIDVLFIGDIDTVLPSIRYVWSGHHLKPVTEDFTALVNEVKEKNKQQFIPSFIVAHNTLHLDEFCDDEDKKKNEILRMIMEMKNNTKYISMNEKENCKTLECVMKDSHFLSIIAIDDIIKMDVQSTIEILSSLGVRYVYYSPYNYTHSRRLAARMGLNTGWNTAISLSDEESKEKLEWECYAQLPHGITQIRNHLLTQDNVPLLVQMFTHSTDAGIEGMLDIMNEWGEGVILISNSSHQNNQSLYKRARLSIAMNQFETNITSYCNIKETDDKSSSNLNASIADVPNSMSAVFSNNVYIFYINELLNAQGATLFINNQTNISVVSSLINESKKWMNNMDNMLIVSVSMLYSLNTIMILNWLLELPPFFYAPYLYPYVFIILPLLCLFLFTAQPQCNENHLYDQLPWKPLNKDEMQSIPKWYIIRVVSRVILVILSIFITQLFMYHSLLLQYHTQSINLFSVLTDTQLRNWLSSSDRVALMIHSIESVFLLICIVIFTAIVTLLLINRTDTLLKNLHQTNSHFLIIWTVVLVLLIWLMGELYCSLSFSHSVIMSISWQSWIILFACCIILIGCDTVLLKKENEQTKVINQIYMWNFNTRLGMWSPE